MAWLDEQRGRQEGQIGDLEGAGVQVEPVSVHQLQLSLHACLQALLPSQPIPEGPCPVTPMQCQKSAMQLRKT